MKGLVSEFRKFAMKGSVVDLAVGVVIGAAFGKIVSSFVANIIMPPLNLITARYGVNFSNLAFKIRTESPKLDDAGQVVKDEAGNPIMAIQDYPILNYGPFIQTIVDFLLISIAIFIAVKAVNKAKEQFEKEQEEAAKEPSEDIVLLREIRDSLKKS
ncbi:MAG: large-conductance mechanosensitive channel protein MscL [Planctomycetota bacterium]